MWGSRPSHFMRIPNTKRHHNNTKTDQLPISEVITGLPSPYHNTPIPPWSSSKCRNTPSTNQLHAFAFQVGRLIWLNKDYCLNTSSSSKIFRQGGNAWTLFDFDNQSAAFFCVDTIKYYSVPSVPSGLEGVKTRPELRWQDSHPTMPSVGETELFDRFWLLRTTPENP